MTKYYMEVKEKKEQYRYIVEMKLASGNYSFSKVVSIAKATVYSKDEIILFFATDKTLKDKVDVYEVVYKEEPVEVNLNIGDHLQFGVGKR